MTPPTSEAVFPTVLEADRIASLPNPVIRNLQITQCYFELSNALTVRTGLNANWCTFATWASKQAGQSIRKEDLRRTLERAFQDPAPAPLAAGSAATPADQTSPRQNLDELWKLARQSFDLRLAVERVSEAVARGNLKVFEEIGREFARFLTEFLNDAQPDPDKLERFCSALRPGEPPEGQGRLTQAFTRYYRAFFAKDPRERAELLLFANIEIGLHEQTRLQPEIVEALNAGSINTLGVLRRVITAGLPFSGRLAIANRWARRLLGRETALDRSLQKVHTMLQLQVRQALTDIMMTIQLPPDRTLRLGEDLTDEFPESLRRLVDPELCALLGQIDPTPDSPAATGTRDWANLPDRLHFIVDLFRCYQESPNLFNAPFTPDQTLRLKAGLLLD